MEKLVKIRVFNSMLYNLEVVEANSVIYVTEDFARYIVGSKRAELIKEEEQQENIGKEVNLNNVENKNIQNKELNEKPLVKKGKK